MYKNSRKEDLINLLIELGEAVEESDTVPQLKSKVEGLEIFKDDPASVSELLFTIIEERKSKAQIEAQKLEVEKIKLAQLEKELEIQQLKNQHSKPSDSPNIPTGSGTSSNSLENLIKSVRTLTIPVPEKSENLNMFFQTLERAFIIKKVPEDIKSEILINLLAEKLSNILSYVSDEDLKSYEKMKDLVLREYQPTALECLIKFKKSLRETGETHVMFCSRIYALFRYYLKLRQVNDFETLVDLIIHDKFLQTLDKDTQSFISLKESDFWLKPNVIAKECDIYFVNRNRSFNEQTSFIHRNKVSDNFKRISDRNKIASSKNHSVGQSFINKNYKEKQITCYVCDGNHYARNCPKRIPNFQQDVKKEINSCENINSDSICNAQCINSADLLINELKYVDLLVNDRLCKALIDSASSMVVCFKEKIHPNKIMSKIVLSSCFNEKRTADLAMVSLALPHKACIDITAAICDNLSCDVILPTNVYEILKAQINKTGSNQNLISTATDLLPRLENDLVSINKQNRSSLCADRKIITENEITSSDLSDERRNSSENDNNCFMKSFLLNMCNLTENYEYDLSHLSDTSFRNKVNNLVRNYEPNKTENTDLKMSIILSDELPVISRVRRLALPEKVEVDKQINEWLENGIIRESCSNYCAPIVVCKKKNGEMRLCVDYRQLNKKIIRDRYPLPVIDDILDKLGQGKIFTTLDLKNAFFHVEIEEKSKKYTSFVTHNGQYEFNKVPFGLSISPLTFQRYINRVFKDLLKDSTMVIYLDDILIPAQNEQEAIEKLTRVLETASKFGLELNLKKCQFLKSKIDFLGHVIENGSIRPSVEKTLAVQNFPEPRSARDVQAFLGLTGYFRKYICSYATIARPLSDLLRGSTTFKFGPEQKIAFQRLKDLLASKPVLTLYRPGADLELHTDASKLGLGAILLQQGEDGKFHPIHYWSKKTSVLEEKFCSYELEVLAVIEALKKFRNYLLGSKFKIYTDCSAFTKTLDKKELSPKVARWYLFLQEFDYKLEHRPAKRMQHVDALSRYPVMSITYDELTHRIIIAQESDEYVKTIKILLQNGQTDEYVLNNNVLFKVIDDREVLVIPEAMQVEVVKNCHALGHFSVAKTEDLVKRDYYFPNLRKCVETVVKNCVKCILVNKKRGKGEGLLNPIPKEDMPLTTYHIDFLGPLPTTNKNYNHIFSVIDAFSKFVWLYPVKSTTTQDALQKLKQQQTIFGNPRRVISDKGPAFTSKEFKEYCEVEGIEHVSITTGVPRGNGQVERLHATIIPILAKLSIEEPDKWFKHIEVVQRTLNSTTSRSTKRTPFELMTGLTMRNKEEKRILELLEEEKINTRMEDLKLIREDAKRNILKIQEENRKNYNKKRKRAHVYKEGDLVAIQRTQFGSGLKLRIKFLGPYEITKVKSNDRYDVKKVGNHEGPVTTSTAADYMKPWSQIADFTGGN